MVIFPLSTYVIKATYFSDVDLPRTRARDRARKNESFALFIQISDLANDISNCTTRLFTFMSLITFGLCRSSQQCCRYDKHDRFVNATEIIESFGRYYFLIKFIRPVAFVSGSVLYDPNTFFSD